MALAPQTKIKLLSLIVFVLVSCYPTTASGNPPRVSTNRINRQQERCEEIQPSVEAMRPHCDAYKNSAINNVDHRAESICWTIRDFDEHCTDEMIQ